MSEMALCLAEKPSRGLVSLSSVKSAPENRFFPFLIVKYHFPKYLAKKEAGKS